VTASASATWPELSALGVAFPQQLGAYAATVTARGPYAGVDDAVDGKGLTAQSPREAWWAQSLDLSIPITPPLGTEEAACQYPYGTAITCGTLPNQVEPNREFYMLAAINNKLRHYPQFANDVGIHCVRDCDGARAYMKAYATYAAAHPGFDANEPTEPIPPPPRPPPRPPTSP
jgi:hypothetical protein